MYLLIIGCCIAFIILVVGCIVSWRIARYTFPDRKRPIISGSITLALTAAIVLGAYLIQPKPCTQGIAPQYSGPPTCVAGNITLDGSTALQPFAQAVANRYTQQCIGSTITVQGSSSQDGLQKLENDQITIADSDVLAPSNMTGLEDHEVVVAVFVVIVNPQVGISNLTSDQLQAIYNGTVMNWKDVGGPNMPITAYRRSEGSGTRITFEQYVLPKHTQTITNPAPLSSPQTVVTSVETTTGAIGYVSYSDAYAYAPERASSLIISIDGTRPDQNLYKNVTDNTYKFWSIEHMYTKGPATGLAKAFLTYMGSDQVNTIATARSFVNINPISSDALAAHCSQ